MADLVHEFAKPLQQFKVRAFAEKRGNVWIGWLEFKGAGKTLKTGEETAQPNKEAGANWAPGLEAGFLGGGLKSGEKGAPKKKRGCRRGRPRPRVGMSPF